MAFEALVTETAVTFGLLVQEPYDPAKHPGEIGGDPEPGDLIYVLAPALRAQEPTPFCVCGHDESVHWASHETMGCSIRRCECEKYNIDARRAQEPTP